LLPSASMHTSWGSQPCILARWPRSSATSGKLRRFGGQPRGQASESGCRSIEAKKMFSLKKGCPGRGRCYDHKFLRFFPIFVEKIGVFLKYQCYINFFQNLTLFWVKNAIFAKIVGENIFKIITSVPGLGSEPGIPWFRLFSYFIT
jgi:hypothetical protein